MSDPVDVERSTSARAEVDKAMFRWARDVAAWTPDDAADAVGVSEAKWREWEDGATFPTMIQLRALADAIQQPVGAFFLPSPPEVPAPLIAFRKLFPSRPSAAVAREARKAVIRRDIAIELEPELDAMSPLLSLAVSTSDEIEEVAFTIRRALGVSLEEQRDEASNAFAYWRRAIEAASVLVFETKAFEIEDARGFCLPQRPFPLIVLNGKDAPTARCFTLAHECVHVLLGEASVCDGGERGDESFCDAVAAAVLLPRDALLADTARRGDAAWSDSELASLARRYGVSEQALLIRLVGLRRAARDEYTSRIAGFRARRALGSDGAPPPHVLTLKYNGYLYPRIVLDALHREAVSFTAAGRYLDLGTQHIEKLETTLRRPER